MNEPSGSQWDIRPYMGRIVAGLGVILILTIIFFAWIVQAVTKQPIMTAVLTAVLIFVIFRGVRRLRRKWDELVKPQ